MPKQNNNLYREIVKLSEDYFGPAAERIIKAQIKNNLHKTPSQLNKRDIPKLVDWLRLFLSVITNDADAIEAYINRIKKIGKK